MLQVQHVTKEYGKVLACNNISFTLPQGSVTVLLGPNGAGKSTLIKSIIGFLRYQGNITVNGLPNKSPEARRLVGYIPEIPALYPNLRPTVCAIIKNGPTHCWTVLNSAIKNANSETSSPRACSRSSTSASACCRSRRSF